MFTKMFEITGYSYDRAYANRITIATVGAREDAVQVVIAAVRSGHWYDIKII